MFFTPVCKSVFVLTWVFVVSLTQSVCVWETLWHCLVMFAAVCPCSSGQLSCWCLVLKHAHVPKRKCWCSLFSRVVELLNSFFFLKFATKWRTKTQSCDIRRQHAHLFACQATERCLCTFLQQPVASRVAMLSSCPPWAFIGPPGVVAAVALSQKHPHTLTCQTTIAHYLTALCWCQCRTQGKNFFFYTIDRVFTHLL